MADRPLTRLRPLPRVEGRIEIRAAEAPLEGDAELLAWIEDEASGEPLMVVAREETELLVWCSLTGSYRMDPSTCTIATGPDHHHGELYEARLLNAIVPLLLAERGEILLHAAALRVPGGALLVCGPTGRGKSTFAGALELRGFPLLAEDGVRITLTPSGALAWPGPTGVRVDDHTAAALGLASVGVRQGRKGLRDGGGVGLDGAPVPVHAIVVLAPRVDGPELEIESPAAIEAVPALMGSVVQAAPDRLPRAFSIAAELARRVPVHVARLPDDLGAIAEAGTELVARVSGAGPLAAGAGSRSFT